MTLNPRNSELLIALPGVWQIAATNLPCWITGERLAPRYLYRALTGRSLTLSETVSWSTPAGDSRTFAGVSRERKNRFHWRGSGRSSFFISRWTVASLDDDAGVALVRFTKTRFNEIGINVIVRQPQTCTEDELRALRVRVAANLESHGISIEEFASLTWLTCEVETVEDRDVDAPMPAYITLAA